MPSELNLNQQADELMELMKDELVIEGNQQQQQQESPKEEEQQQEQQQQQEPPKNEEPPKQEDNSDDDSEKLVSEFFKIIGVEEEIKLESFDINTLAEKTKEIIEKVREEVAELKSDEDIVKLAEWKKSGGTLNTFMAIPQRIEYSKLELKEEDEESQIGAIKTYLTLKGDDAQEIDERIEFLKDKGKLLENAQKALINLDKLNEKEVNDYQASETARIKEQTDKIENTWKEVETIVKSGVVNDYKLPESEKATFSKYVLRDEKGVSQADLKRGQLTTQQMLLIDYLIMKDFKVVGLDKLKVDKQPEQRSIGVMFKGKSSAQNTKELTLDEIL
jgi:hypothetical protein